MIINLGTNLFFKCFIAYSMELNKHFQVTCSTLTFGGQKSFQPKVFSSFLFVWVIGNTTLSRGTQN